VAEMGASPKSCFTRWLERASWWNGHLGGMAIRGGTGILPVTIFGQAVPTLLKRRKKRGRSALA